MVSDLISKLCNAECSHDTLTICQMLCLSDLFMEREQFEFMQDILLDLIKAHPAEDELSSQYIVAALCKATAVIGAVSSRRKSLFCLIFSYLSMNVYYDVSLFQMQCSQTKSSRKSECAIGGQFWSNVKVITQHK